MAEKRIKKWIELARAVLPVFVFLVVIAEHVGAIDRLRGLDKVQQVAYRLTQAGQYIQMTRNGNQRLH